MILIMVGLVHKQEASRVGRRGHLKFPGLRGTLRKVKTSHAWLTLRELGRSDHILFLKVLCKL